MKKVFILLLIPIFLLTTGGIAFNIHFCKMRGVSDVSIAFDHKESCCGGDAMDNECCKNEVKVCKIKDDYSTPAKLNCEKESILLITFFPAILHEPVLLGSFRISNYHPPPPEERIALYVLHHSILV